MGVEKVVDSIVAGWPTGLIIKVGKDQLLYKYSSRKTGGITTEVLIFHLQIKQPSTPTLDLQQLEQYSTVNQHIFSDAKNRVINNSYCILPASIIIVKINNSYCILPASIIIVKVNNSYYILPASIIIVKSIIINNSYCILPALTTATVFHLRQYTRTLIIINNSYYILPGLKVVYYNYYISPAFIITTIFCLRRYARTADSIATLIQQILKIYYKNPSTSTYSWATSSCWSPSIGLFYF
ncbi:hypothetical protein BO82DRAFT_363115 [Aspergillus uvarum CBS 121591]|uniref:Uncharacterized protein n=1 Tax=Aspergillus uvarum CBS 121591 TaxID=1448315 RepID=A0A319CCE3_9EURO|nr:hypothetical protein BO82DRAFT_363115 [Aspergillus uvarum CBS 121591]PYH83536.1 hypothetical protein BO82DRAFT_363115 [Aspergillus uvarum CBS 121591]